jgi:MFS family permease
MLRQLWLGASNAARRPRAVANPDTHNVRAVLAVRGLRRLLGVRLASQFSDGVFQAALAGSVLFNPDRRAGALAIAGGSAVLLLPYSVIGPYVGVLLDRWSRRQVLVWTNLIRALLALPAAALIFFGQQGPPFILVTFLIIGMNRFFLAGLSAALPHVVADRRLVTANALSGTLGSLCYSLGLATAIALLETVLKTGFHGYSGVAVLAPLGYLGSALLAYRSFSLRELGPDSRECRRDTLVSGLAEVGRGMVEGIRHLATRRGAAYGMLAQSAFRGLYGVLALVTLLLYRDYFGSAEDFHASISGLAQVFVAGSLGVLLAAGLTPTVTRHIGGWRWVTALLTATAVAVLVGGLPFRPGMLVLAVFVVNIASQGIKIVVDTSLQHECADEYRGRVFSVNDTTFNLTYVLGMFIAALTVSPDGHSPAAVIVVAIGYALVAGWYTMVAGRWARQQGDDIAHRAPDPLASRI